MILNPEKCHYICLGKDYVSDLLRFCGEVLETNELETVIGIQINNKLNFENHTKSLCSKASQKLGALQRFSNLLDAQKKNLLFSSVINSQFSSELFMMIKIAFPLNFYSPRMNVLFISKMSMFS